MELNQDAQHAACEKVIAGLNAQLTEQFEISSKYVMALETAARMAEQGILSADGGQAATEIRSLVDAKYRLASALDDGSCTRCGCVPRGSGGLCATCRDEDVTMLEALRTIAAATDADNPESYRCDDREGCLDTVHAIARSALAEAPKE